MSCHDKGCTENSHLGVHPPDPISLPGKSEICHAGWASSHGCASLCHLTFCLCASQPPASLLNRLHDRCRQSSLWQLPNRSHLWATFNVLVWYKYSFVPTSLNMCSDAFHYKRPIDIAHTSLTGQRMNLQHLFLGGGQWTAIVLICKSVSSGSPDWCQQRQQPWADAHHHRYFRAYSKAHMPTDVKPTTFIVWFLSVTHLTN